MHELGFIKNGEQVERVERVENPPKTIIYKRLVCSLHPSTEHISIECITAAPLFYIVIMLNINKPPLCVIYALCGTRNLGDSLMHMVRCAPTITDPQFIVSFSPGICILISRNLFLYSGSLHETRFLHIPARCMRTWNSRAAVVASHKRPSRVCKGKRRVRTIFVRGGQNRIPEYFFRVIVVISGWFFSYPLTTML